LDGLRLNRADDMSSWCEELSTLCLCCTRAKNLSADSVRVCLGLTDTVSALAAAAAVAGADATDEALECTLDVPNDWSDEDDSRDMDTDKAG
jgi:hypothetical protein